MFVDILSAIGTWSSTFVGDRLVLFRLFLLFLILRLPTTLIMQPLET
jgi:hypothetical protein